MPGKNKGSSGQSSAIDRYTAGLDQHKVWLIIGIGLAVVLVLVGVFLSQRGKVVVKE